MSKITILKSNLSKQVLIYCTYYLLIWLTQLILLSVSAYFHFLLSHRLEIIEEWIWDRGWILIVVSKLLSFYVMVQFISLQDSSRTALRNILSAKIAPLKLEVVVASALLFVLFVYLGAPAQFSKTSIQIEQVVMSYFGNILFYIIDIFFIVVLQNYFPVGNRKKLSKIFLFGILFFGLAKLIYFYATDLNYVVTINFLFCLYILEYLPTNLKNVFAFLAIFVSPLSAFMGNDPIWGNSFSVFILNSKFTFFLLFINYAIGFAYIYVKENSWTYIKKAALTLLHQVARYYR